MKIFIIVILSLFIGILYMCNRRLKNELASKKHNHYYQTNLSREEMKEALYYATNDSIALFIPADVSVMPYLVKHQEKRLVGEYVKR